MEILRGMRSAAADSDTAKRMGNLWVGNSASLEANAGKILPYDGGEGTEKAEASGELELWRKIGDWVAHSHQYGPYFPKLCAEVAELCGDESQELALALGVFCDMDMQDPVFRSANETKETERISNWVARSKNLWEPMYAWLERAKPETVARALDRMMKHSGPVVDEDRASFARALLMAKPESLKILAHGDPMPEWLLEWGEESDPVDMDYLIVFRRNAPPAQAQRAVGKLAEIAGRMDSFIREGESCQLAAEGFKKAQSHLEAAAMLLHWGAAEDLENRRGGLPPLEKPVFLEPADWDGKAEKMISLAFRHASPLRAAQVAQAALWIAGKQSAKALARAARERAKGVAGDMEPDEMQILLDVFENNCIGPVEFLSQESRMGASKMELALEQLENFGEQKAQILRARLERWQLANPEEELKMRLKMPAAPQMEEFLRLVALAGADPQEALGKLMKELEAQAQARETSCGGKAAGLSAAPAKRI